MIFEEGDPDQPLIIGSVYNAENMPPMMLPACNMFSGIKSASMTRGSATGNFNSLVFVDLKGQEHLAIHSERHMVLNAEYDVAAQAGRHHFERVPGAHVLTVGSTAGRRRQWRSANQHPHDEHGRRQHLGSACAAGRRRAQRHHGVWIGIPIQHPLSLSACQWQHGPDVR